MALETVLVSVNHVKSPADMLLFSYNTSYSLTRRCFFSIDDQNKMNVGKFPTILVSACIEWVVFRSSPLPSLLFLRPFSIISLFSLVRRHDSSSLVFILTSLNRDFAALFHFRNDQNKNSQYLPSLSRFHASFRGLQ